MYEKVYLITLIMYLALNAISENAFGRGKRILVFSGLAGWGIFC
jgi:hypothetical protein